MRFKVSEYVSSLKKNITYGQILTINKYQKYNWIGSNFPKEDPSVYDVLTASRFFSSSEKALF
jgi:hypothetical protein